jgi:hypothetical protein
VVAAASRRLADAPMYCDVCASGNTSALPFSSCTTVRPAVLTAGATSTTMDVDADGKVGKLPAITVLWMMHDGKLDDERGTIYVDRADIAALQNYRAGFRASFNRLTYEPPQRISYEQFRDT